MPDSIEIRDDVVYREIDGEVVALSIATGAYVSLDAVGSDIWRLIERFGSIDKITAALLEAYDLDADACRAEVAGYIASLEARGFLACASR